MKGKVYLVGAGPGDFKLITLKGIECIKNADVIVYDRLANEKFLNYCKEDCTFIYVGKQSKNHFKTQDEINEIIYLEAKNGKNVVRLKGGDPYVFGRGAEEAEYLLERGIEFEIVPGVTSAIGGLSYAGIPITHREFASSFHVITGHLKDENEELDWESLSKLKGTLVFLMGMSNLKNICNNLIKCGKDNETKVAIINWATTNNQKVVTGTLDTIYDIAIKNNIASPSLIVVGEVVSLRNKLNFFEKKPLFSKNIVVTRSRSQNSKLVSEIINLGGNPIEFPVIKIEPIVPNYELDNCIENINEYNYIVFTSENSVNIFFERLNNLGLDSRVLYNSKIVSIGSSTTKTLNEKGIKSDIIPRKFVSEFVVEELKTMLNKDDKILIPRSYNAREYLINELSKISNVNECKIYKTVKDDSNKTNIQKLLNENKIDYITFTSSSTVKNFVEIIGAENLQQLKNTKIISIGPSTTKTILNFGLDVYKESKVYNINGIIKELIQDRKE